MRGLLYLEDGTIYEGKGFGKKGTSVGELVFNTSMTGYQEILTDPSYAGQIIAMTYPLIGNYGINHLEGESKNIYAKGLITKVISNNPSNYLSEETLDIMLKNMNIVGVYDVDTRSITKKIRKIGCMKCVISNENITEKQIKKYLFTAKIDNSYVERVSTKKIVHIQGNGPKVAVLDLGVKENIIKNLKYRDCDISILPYNTCYEKILEINPNGIVLSNGPGNPKCIKGIIETVKKLINKFPIFGICLGHQILALAVGGNTYKMKYGHRGGNHGVYDIDKDRAYITSQNHGYSVDKDSVEDKGMIITHINLNDNTVEGMKHNKLPIFSVQFHPEGSPGPEDTTYLFDKFIEKIKKNR